MTVVHFLNNLDRDSGGPSVSVPGLCRALAAEPGLRVVLAARRTAKAVETRPEDGFRVVWIDGGRDSVAGVLAEARESAPAGGPVVHVHGLWDPLYHRASALARAGGLPLVVSTRGMLEPWALRHKGLKKRIAWLLYQRRDLLGAAALHATSEAELSSFRRAGLEAVPSVLIPNGVTPPPDLEALREGAPRERVLLFLGRLHPVKGLPPLLDAWAEAAPPGWTLRLAGPDSEGHRGELEARVRRHGIARGVEFAGAVDEAGKWRALAGASALVLPSYSENFGLVVAEALAAGTPAAASTGTPWGVLETERAGWQVAPEREAWVAFLRRLGDTPAGTLAAMGRRGRELVARDFAWSGVAARFAELYRRDLGGRP